MHSGQIGIGIKMGICCAIPERMNCAVPARKHSVATIAILFLLVCVSDASACPACNYERMLLSNWYLKVWIIKLSLPLVFSFSRLDVVHVLYVFLAYTHGFIFAFKYLIWFGHPAVNDGFIGTLSGIGLLVFGLNIPDAALLFLLGCIPFFRRDKAKGLPISQVLAFALAACAVSWCFLGRV